MHGWYYDILTGRIEEYDESRRGLWCWRVKAVSALPAWRGVARRLCEQLWLRCTLFAAQSGRCLRDKALLDTFSPALDAVQFQSLRLYPQEDPPCCEFASSITTNVLTELARPPCSLDFIASALRQTRATSITGWCYRAGALFDESEFTGDETRSSISNNHRRPKSPGGSIITNRHS